MEKVVCMKRARMGGRERVASICLHDTQYSVYSKYTMRVDGQHPVQRLSRRRIPKFRCCNCCSSKKAGSHRKSYDRCVPRRGACTERATLARVFE